MCHRAAQCTRTDTWSSSVTKVAQSLRRLLNRRAEVAQALLLTTSEQLHVRMQHTPSRNASRLGCACLQCMYMNGIILWGQHEQHWRHTRQERLRSSSQGASAQHLPNCTQQSHCTNVAVWFGSLQGLREHAHRRHATGSPSDPTGHQCAPSIPNQRIKARSPNRTRQ